MAQNQDSSSPSSHEAESLRRREIFELREKLDLIVAGFGEIQTQAARIRARYFEVMRSMESMDMWGVVFRLKNLFVLNFAMNFKISLIFICSELCGNSVAEVHFL